MDWHNLKFFLAIARAGSITGASRELGVNYTTVARRLASFEEELGTTLFERLSSGLKLTCDGTEMLNRASPLEQELNALLTDVGGKNQATAGHIIFTLSQNMSAIVLPFLKQFYTQYPAITVDLVVCTETLDIVDREADIAIRCDNTPPESLIGRQIATTTIAPYARRGLIDADITFGDLSSHPWIVWDAKRNHNHSEQFNAQFIPPCASTLMTVSDAHTQLQAVRSGLGLAWLWRYVGDNENDIEIVSTDYPHYESCLWVLMNPQLRDSERHRLFYEQLCQYLLGHPQLQSHKA